MVHLEVGTAPWWLAGRLLHGRQVLGWTSPGKKGLDHTSCPDSNGEAVAACGGPKEERVGWPRPGELLCG